jgi:hypothetical protein
MAKNDITRRRSTPTRKAAPIRIVLIFTDLSSAHPDFLKLSIGKPLSFEFDSRLAFLPGKQRRKV